MARDTPDRPNLKSTWKESQVNGFTSIGPFVLNKGESIDNGSLGVKILDFVPRSCRSYFSHSPDQPKAVFQFYQPADGHVLCEVTLSGPANSRIDVKQMCGEPVAGITVVGINGINAREGWVSFDLRK